MKSDYIRRWDVVVGGCRLGRVGSPSTRMLKQDGVQGRKGEAWAGNWLRKRGE
jgi:hypothetical protein